MCLFLIKATLNKKAKEVQNTTKLNQYVNLPLAEMPHLHLKSSGSEWATNTNNY